MADSLPHSGNMAWMMMSTALVQMMVSPFAVAGR
jgi:ammonia channel protein AmtB